MEWSGVARRGMEWSEVALSGVAWSGLHAAPRYATPIHATPRYSTPLHINATPLHPTQRHCTPLHVTPLKSTPLTPRHEFLLTVPCSQSVHLPACPCVSVSSCLIVNAHCFLFATLCAHPTQAHACTTKILVILQKRLVGRFALEQYDQY